MDQFARMQLPTTSASGAPALASTMARRSAMGHDRTSSTTHDLVARSSILYVSLSASEICAELGPSSGFVHDVTAMMHNAEPNMTAERRRWMHMRDEVETLRGELERERERAERAEMVLEIMLGVMESSTWFAGMRRTLPATPP